MVAWTVQEVGVARALQEKNRQVIMVKGASIEHFLFTSKILFSILAMMLLDNIRKWWIIKEKISELRFLTALSVLVYYMQHLFGDFTLSNAGSSMGSVQQSYELRGLH